MIISHFMPARRLKRLAGYVMMASVLCGVSTPVAYSANPSAEIEARARALREDPSLVCGIGIADDREIAMQAALADLARKISVTVSSESTLNEIDRFGAGNPDSGTSTEFQSIIRSYATPTSLRGVKTLWINEKVPFQVMAYIETSKIDEIYRKRKDAVGDLCRSAVSAEKQGRIDDALRYLYRAFAVLRSVPDYENTGEYVDGQTRMLQTWIPEKMRQICGDVTFGIADVRPAGERESSGKYVSIMAHYKDKPLSSIAFTYWTGTGTSPVITAHNGISEILMNPNTILDQLAVDIEYRFQDENHLVTDYQPLLEAFNNVPMSIGAKKVLAENARQVKPSGREAKMFKEVVNTGAHEGIEAADRKETKEMAATVDRIVKAISARDYESVRDCFTPEGYAMFETLIHYGQARILGKAGRDSYEFYPINDRTVCRSVPMSFSFNNGKKQFTEDVTFTFGPEGKVECMAFALTNRARQDIFGMNGSAWNDHIKMTIVSFLENYKTAFALKRLDYIESIFDDDAVIITGHVVKKANLTKGEHRGMTNSKYVTYTRHTKEQYIERLRKCFQGNSYINIRFTSSEVGSTTYGPNTFGIQLQQEYVSSTYGDTGYLYLLVDFTDPEAPLITFRCWQPERNPDLTPNLPRPSPAYGIFSNGTLG